MTVRYLRRVQVRSQQLCLDCGNNLWHVFVRAINDQELELVTEWMLCRECDFA